MARYRVTVLRNVTQRARLTVDVEAEDGQGINDAVICAAVICAVDDANHEGQRLRWQLDDDGGDWEVESMEPIR